MARTVTFAESNPRAHAVTMAAPHGGALIAAAVAPPPTNVPVHASKHAAVAEDVEEGMVGTMQEMRVATVQQRQEIAEQLDHIRDRGVAVRQRLAEERDARDKQYAAMQASMAASFSVLERAISDGIEAAFASASARVPPLHRMLDTLVKREEVAYSEEVPAAIEQQCGEHVRTMEAHREALQLDNATIVAREAKIWQRVEKHTRAFDTRVRVEEEDRARQYDTLLAQMTASVTTLDDAATHSHPKLEAHLTELHAAIAREAEARRVTDAHALQVAHSVMERLQHTALSNFGTEEVVAQFTVQAQPPPSMTPAPVVEASVTVPPALDRGKGAGSSSSVASKASVGTARGAKTSGPAAASTAATRSTAGSRTGSAAAKK